MVRITEIVESDAVTRLRIEGRLTQEHVDELLRTTARCAPRGTTLLLELAGVTFADAAGIAALHSLERGGAVMVGCSGFLVEMLGTQRAAGELPEMSATSDEARLVERLRSGDEDAFEELVRRYGGRMLATARRMLGSESDARDAVQDAFLAVFKSIETFNGAAKLSTWLHRIVVNTALMKLRGRRRKPEESIDELLPHFDEQGEWAGSVGGWATPADGLLQQRETREVVRACIDRLPETYRTVLMLRDIEDLDTEEAAQVLGTTPNALKIRLHRARQALRTLLVAELGESKPATVRRAS